MFFLKFIKYRGNSEHVFLKSFNLLFCKVVRQLENISIAVVYNI